MSPNKRLPLGCDQIGVFFPLKPHSHKTSFACKFGDSGVFECKLKPECQTIIFQNMNFVTLPISRLKHVCLNESTSNAIKVGGVKWSHKSNNLFSFSCHPTATHYWFPWLHVTHAQSTLSCLYRDAQRFQLTQILIQLT